MRWQCPWFTFRDIDGDGVCKRNSNSNNSNSNGKLAKSFGSTEKYWKKNSSITAARVHCHYQQKLVEAKATTAAQEAAVKKNGKEYSSDYTGDGPGNKKGPKALGSDQLNMLILEAQAKLERTPGDKHLQKVLDSYLRDLQSAEAALYSAGSSSGRVHKGSDRPPAESEALTDLQLKLMKILQNVSDHMQNKVFGAVKDADDDLVTWRTTNGAYNALGAKGEAELLVSARCYCLNDEVTYGVWTCGRVQPEVHQGNCIYCGHGCGYYTGIWFVSCSTHANFDFSRYDMGANQR